MQLLAAAELAGAKEIQACKKCGQVHIGACSMKAMIKAGVRENMEAHPNGGLKCKLCGSKAAHPRAAAAHLAIHHRDALEAQGLEARDFSQGQRDKLAKSGEAMPDGSFPIANAHDLANARKAVGRAKNPAAAKAHIAKRAKALGVA